MAKVKAKKTVAIHEACADRQVMPDRPATWRDLMREWAFQYQIGCYGLNEFNHRDHAKIAKYRAEVGAPAIP